MKDLNLTGLYLALMAKYGIRSFKVNSLVRNGSVDPIDAAIDFYCDPTLVNVDEVKTILDQNISGPVKQAIPTLKSDRIEIYVEFMGNDDFGKNFES